MKYMLNHDFCVRECCVITENNGAEGTAHDFRLVSSTLLHLIIMIYHLCLIDLLRKMRKYTWVGLPEKFSYHYFKYYHIYVLVCLCVGVCLCVPFWHTYILMSWSMCGGQRAVLWESALSFHCLGCGDWAPHQAYRLTPFHPSHLSASIYQFRSGKASP